jgi:hypothetical protein
MKKIIVFLVVTFCQLGFACHCEDFQRVQKKAVAENKFIIVHFSNFFSYQSDDMSGIPIVNSIQEHEEVRQLIGNYLYVCATSSLNIQLIKRFQITQFPAALIIDPNGKEIYRFKDVENSTEFYAAISNFSHSSGLLPGDVKGFYQKRSYYSALRIAQKYFDYSLTIEPQFKRTVYDTAKLYLTEAEQLLSKKEKDYAQKKQKLELMNLLHWAYERNFSMLDQELAGFIPENVDQSNINLYYFLKYITAKALQQEDFSIIEQKTRAMDGFEPFVQKAAAILSV